MANIGSFKKVDNEFQGEIVTLSVQTKGVRIVPETNRGNDNAPSHRVYVGRADMRSDVLCGVARLEPSFSAELHGVVRRIIPLIEPRRSTHRPP